MDNLVKVSSSTTTDKVARSKASELDYRVLLLSPENALGIDDDKNSAAAGQNSFLLIEDLCNASKAASALIDLSRFDTQRAMQRDGP